MGEATAVEAAPAGLAGNGRPRRDAAAWDRLEDQIAWYDRKSGQCQRGFQLLKVCQIVIAAAIPVVAGAGGGAWRWLVAVGGASIVVLEGLQQLFQFQQNWTSYRSTCERLKHERVLYEVGAGPYAGAAQPQALLAERVESLVSQEHAAWASAQRQAQDGRR